MNNELKTWHFDIDNDKLVQLVLSGKKTASISLYEKNNIPKIGEEKILTFDNEKKACITKTNKVIITEFKNITEKLSSLDSEDNYENWQKTHIDYFKLADPTFNEDTKVIFEIFEVKENLVKQRLELAKTITKANSDIFGEIKKVEEVNAGFNNSIFSVNGKYIIKVCGNKEKEDLFDIEANFYNSNQNNESIPVLYKYDASKEIVPYVYEIIEKITGKSVYYHWYKMNELQRETFIKDLVLVLKNIHLKEYPAYDWCGEIKEKVLSYFKQTEDLFTEEEKGIILNATDKYDKVLADNRFCLIHGDLHFDNILIDKDKKIKLIDFNDSVVAPFDYDLRLLYRSVKEPWKWADIQMDPYQKTDDYKNLFEYIKRYYEELNDVDYLEERMLIYSMVDDFRLLTRLRNDELKENVIAYSKEILNAFKNKTLVK